MDYDNRKNEKLFTFQCYWSLSKHPNTASNGASVGIQTQLVTDLS